MSDENNTTMLVLFIIIAGAIAIGTGLNKEEIRRLMERDDDRME